ncbi:MAG: PAS domain S-box protein, partial [Desulfobulbaceae bacterium]|nr:PAS domain S-box protein [Desulfobulbaceae bacterium]
MRNSATELQELRIKNKLSKLFLTMSDEKLLYAEALKIITDAFASQFGAFGYCTDDGSFVIPAVTREVYRDQCQVEDKEIIFANADFCGIRQKALTEKKSFYDNSGPFSTPAGHIPIENTMVAPIIFRKKIISAIHIANKAGGYSDKDLRLLDAITDHLAPVLAARLEKDREENKRRQAEEALRDSEELHRITIENITDPLFITDDQGNFTYICGNVPHLLHYSVEEIRAMGNLKQLAGNDLFTMIAQSSAGEICNINCMIADKKGIHRHFLTNVKRVAIRNGSLLFTFHDVTELKHAADALRQSEYQWREFFDNMSSGMAVYKAVDEGRDFIFKDINRSGMKICKVTREEIVGRSVRQVLPGVVDMGLFAVFQRVWKTGLSENHPVSHYQDNRISQWMKNYVFRLPSGEIVAVFDDIITEQIIALKEVQKNERKFRRLLESTCTVPWELDLASGKFTFMGKQIETILGYPADSWLDMQTWVDRLYEEDRKYAVAFCNNETRKEKDHDFTYRAVHADGTIKWIQDIISVVRGNNGPEKLIGFMIDITAKKNIEKEKVLLENNLRHAQQMETIGTLAGGIAHDFNNILGSIIGYADLMAEDVPPGSQFAADLEQILTAGHKAKNLVQQILAFSHQ